ncbi:MAG: hypothetical protein JRN52_12495 [Nitrososphaerota archaeon]|nr:hypothetical protein [Nitrososphaerota archaeon]
MIKKLVLAGVVILLVGGYFLYSPSTYGMVASFSGLSTSAVTYDQNFALQVKSSNYAFEAISLTPKDSLSLTFQADSPGVNFFLMNSGNFSVFRGGVSSAYSVYPQSKLAVENYSFQFTPTVPNGTYYLVFTSVSSNATTSVLAHAVVLTSNKVVGSDYVPIAIILAGLTLLGIGINFGKKQPEKKTVPVVKSTQPTCRYCKATLKPDSPFCPSCGKSQT